jgi:hypothetical protein
VMILRQFQQPLAATRPTADVRGTPTKAEPALNGDSLTIKPSGSVSILYISVTAWAERWCNRF